MTKDTIDKGELKTIKTKLGEIQVVVSPYLKDNIIMISANLPEVLTTAINIQEALVAESK